MDFLLLALIILLQLALSLSVSFSGLNKSRFLLLFSLTLNLTLGIIVPYFLCKFIWLHMLNILHISQPLIVLIHEPLTLGGAISLLVAVSIPLLYFKWVCMPLVRDASVNYGNCVRALKAKQHHN
jgi:hypothetical protein